MTDTPLEEARADYDAAVREVASEPEWTEDYSHLLREREANAAVLAESWGALIAEAKAEAVEPLWRALQEYEWWPASSAVDDLFCLTCEVAEGDEHVSWCFWVTEPALAEARRACEGTERGQP